MTKKDLMIVIENSAESSLTFAELSEAFGVNDEFVRELIEYDIIALETSMPEQWVFDMGQLRRIKTALRLQRDLEVNLAGVAVILDLLEELEELRERAKFWNQQFK